MCVCTCARRQLISLYFLFSSPNCVCVPVVFSWLCLPCNSFFLLFSSLPAPELCLHQRYDHTVDVWALGVIMYCLLVGFHPFNPYGTDDRAVVTARIIDADFTFDGEEWESKDAEVKGILRKLLRKNPKERMTLDAFLGTNFIQVFALTTTPSYRHALAQTDSVVYITPLTNCF